MFFVSIPEPCHEKWDEMTPNEKGVFCVLCSKTVVDFTKLSDNEVKNYLFSHSGQKTRGRFRKDQLSNDQTRLVWLLNEPVAF